jgi:WD40 repeat protein/beta-lactamase regulating signal transducer with metallopeptidase domain
METAQATDAPVLGERVVTGAATMKAVADDNSESLSISSLAMLSRAAPWITVAYVVGVAYFLLRLSTALWGGHRLRTRTAHVTDAKLLELIADQADRVKLKCVPVVAYCERVAVPTVVGVLRPMVLLPVSLMTGLAPDDFAAIIRHELAHIRRYDLWMNLLQRVIESLLFFHPAVWFISRRLSAEREVCCDDLVVSSGYEPMHYAGALLRMAELCAISRQGGALALAATGEKAPLLEKRIERLMNWGNTPRLQLTRAGMAGLLITLVSLTVVLGIAHTWAQAQAREVVQPDDPLPAGSTLRFGTSRFRFGIPVSNMAVSSDGKIAIAANDNHMQGSTRVFDLVSGRVLYSLANQGNIEAAAISPDGRTIVTKQDFSLCIRDAATGRELRKIGLERFNSYSRNEWVTFTPDGKAIAVTSQGKVIHLIDFASGKKIRDFSNDNPESSLSKSFSTVLGIAFSRDGKLMASGGFANDQGTYFARLWEVKTGKEIRRFAHSKRSYGIRSLAFSPDAKTLATRSHDGRLRLFDVDTGKERKTFPKDGGGRRGGTVAFSPDGKTVAAAGDSIRLYDAATGEERLRINRKQASYLQFTDGGKTLTGAFMGAIYRWDTATGKSLTPEAGDSVVEQILVTAHGSLVVTRGQRGDVHIWDGTNGKHLRRIEDTVWQQDLAMSPDDRFLVWPVEDRSIHFRDPRNPRLGHYGSRIRLYDIAADRFVDRFPGFKGDAGDLTFTNDGKKLITVGHRDGMVRLWNLGTGKQERSFQAVPDAEKNESRQVTHTALSPDGKTLAVAYHPYEDSRLEGGRRVLRLGRLTSRPRPVRLWDVATGKQRHQLKGAHGDMAFSPDGRFFVTASRTVWETATGKRVAALPDGPSIRALAFSRDGRFLATAVAGEVIQVWEVATWKKRNEFKGHRDPLTALAFTPGGQLLSGSADTTVLAWDLPRRDRRD